MVVEKVFIHNVLADNFSSDNQNLIVVVDGSSQTISIVANCDTAVNCATVLSEQITGATVSAVGDNLVITSATTKQKPVVVHILI